MTNETRRIFYVDVGNMTSKEAQIALNKIRANLGLPPITTWTIDLIFVGFILAAFSFTLATLA